MGAGDWIMATAIAKKLHQINKRPVLIVNRSGQPQWHPVFDGNPRLARMPGRNVQRLLNCSGSRHYIAAKGPERWAWKRWDISPGEIYLTADEKAFGAAHGGRILVEPHTKVVGSNKAWIWDRWQALVDCGGEFVQVGPAGTQLLRGVNFVETPSFRHACAVLAASRAFVGTEGGLHHAAAALGVPAVVLFSEFIGTDITGYPQHRNLRHAGEACGARTPCEGCRASMEAITVEEVRRNLMEIIG